ncbi:MAG: helix-turn-helix transcriptional regulator [Actinobacteria bacterium]|nr:helix-turn-helix transcriptional regulator [Actinomycetota bacterium]
MSSRPPDLEFCPRVAGVFEILGKRWTGPVIDLLLQRPSRFCELARAVPRLSERVLGERLRELEAAGLVERTVDSGPPIAVTYAITPLGEGLRPAMDALREWAAELDRNRLVSA